MTVGYYRRWYGNFNTTDNLGVRPADYDPYCVKAPVDARLPNGGGYDVCGLYDIKREKFGQGISKTVKAKNFGKQTEIYDGFDISGNMRLAGGAVVNGGLNIGRTSTNSCFVVDSPQEMLNCDRKPPFQPNMRLITSYPLPVWDVLVSAMILVNPPPEVTASYTVSSSQVTGLGRSLSGGTATVPLIAPGTMFGEYAKQLDFRLAKRLRIGRYRLQASVDVFNLLNANAAQSQNNTYGRNWLQLGNVQQGRYVQFSSQLDF